MSQVSRTQKCRWRRGHQRGENIERSDAAGALLSNITALLETADPILSAAPIPGVANALPVLKTLIERISLMRANVQAKQDVVSRIQALIRLLVSNATEVSADIERLAPSEREGVKGEARRSSALKSRIDTFVAKLHDILACTQIPRHEQWYRRLWFAEQDAEFLKDLGRKIDDVKDGFSLEGALEIRKHVGDLVTTSLGIWRELRVRNDREEDRDIRQVLEGLKPANASYKLAQFEEKSRLTPGTRSTILRDLGEWAVTSGVDQRMYVLFGQAGTGKSSIAHAFCRQLPDGQLGASFFFLRDSGECSDVYRVFPTLAHQLAESISSLRPHIAEAARKQQAGREQALVHQFETLIMGPLKTLAKSPSSPLIIFVLDGVDECARTPADSISTMLELLHQAAHRISFLRILIATRPETYILDPLRSCDDSGMITWRDLQKESDVDRDIRQFINTELERCKKAGPFDLLEQYPDAAAELTRLSDGLFIYASTVFKYITQKKHSAIERYEAFLTSDNRLDPGEAYKKLDMLYMRILRDAFSDIQEKQKQMACMRQILCWLALLKPNPVMLAPNAGELKLIGIPTPTTLDVLEGLRSVLTVDGDITPATRIRACHASFPQFLSDSARCTDPAFLVDRPSGHSMIATSLLDLLARDDVDSLRDADGHMPEMWRYAVRRWDDHLCGARYTSELGRALRGFVGTHLEHWVERKNPWSIGRAHRLVSLVDYCADVRTWYTKNGPDDGLAAALDTIIDRRVEEIVAEAAQSPDKFRDWHLERIKVWAKKGYTR